jgi:head-tail adaptor
MRGGQLDRRITIERPTTVDDPLYGPQPGGWEVFGVARMPARVMDDLPSKSESTTEGLRLAERPARVRIRYLVGITSDMRVTLHDVVDTVFQISGGPAELGRHEWTEFTVKAYSA